MDNKTAIAYINRMGGTRSHTFSQVACNLWHWCLQRGITLSAEHQPEHDSRLGVQNTAVISGIKAGRCHMPQDHTATGPMHSGSLCNSAKQPVGQVCQLASRSILHSDRCPPDVMAIGSGVCIPTIYTDRPVPTENPQRG